MSNPFKTREGGATVTVFAPYDCGNHCPFCVNKEEYADTSGFSLERSWKASVRSKPSPPAVTSFSPAANRWPIWIPCS